MALLFSAVTVTAKDKKVEFLVGGIPREFSDLEGWTAFERFMEDISVSGRSSSRLGRQRRANKILKSMFLTKSK